MYISFLGFHWKGKQHSYCCLPTCSEPLFSGCFYLFNFFKHFFFGYVPCGILILRPRIESWPTAVKAHNLNHWTTRKSSSGCLYFLNNFIGVLLLYNVLVFNRVNPLYGYLPVSPLSRISFPFRSPQSTEQSSLCYTVGSH